MVLFSIGQYLSHIRGLLDEGLKNNATNTSILTSPEVALNVEYSHMVSVEYDKYVLHAHLDVNYMDQMNEDMKNPEELLLNSTQQRHMQMFYGIIQDLMVFIMK